MQGRVFVGSLSTETVAPALCHLSSREHAPLSPWSGRTAFNVTQQPPTVGELVGYTRQALQSHAKLVTAGRQQLQQLWQLFWR